MRDGAGRSPARGGRRDDDVRACLAHVIENKQSANRPARPWRFTRLVA